MLHPRHVLIGDHAEAAGGGHEDVRGLDHVVDGRDLVAVHRRLEGADRIHLGHDDPRTLTTQTLGAALADVAVAEHHGDLPADQHIGGPVDPVDQRMPAAVLVVELALGHRVVHVDRREQQVPCLLHLVQPVHAGRGLLGHPLDPGGDPRPAAVVLPQRPRQHTEDDLVLLRVGALRRRNRSDRLELGALVHQQRGVTTIVEDHVRALPVRPEQHLLGAPPVLVEGLALPGVDRDTRRSVRGAGRADDDRRRRVVLGGEDVAGRPPDLRAERHQRLDQHRGLDRHVQRTGDPRTLQRLPRGELPPDRHQTRHLMLGQLDLLTPEGRQRQIRHLEIAEVASHARTLPHPRRGPLESRSTGLMLRTPGHPGPGCGAGAVRSCGWPGRPGRT
ncbi:hypothetical protein LUPAC06_03656 [Micromonospora saelicesensis]|nr:hypothetical protein LUPAC06_03656 [Micromonospora saelicesensis]